jgi:hypothetical protein
MDNCKPIKTPMHTNGHLDLDEGGKPVDQKLYHSMIGSLLYLTASRPDIMFSVCMCARFQANHKESHLSALKRILRYLKYTPSIGLWSGFLIPTGRAEPVGSGTGLPVRFIRKPVDRRNSNFKSKS